VFKWIGNVYGGLPVLQELPLTANEAGVLGTAMKFNAGALTVCTGNATAVAAIAHENKDASAAAQTILCHLVRPGDLFEVDYTGVADAGFIVGAMTVDVAANGLSLDAADVTNGAFTVTEIDATNAKAYGYFNRCALSQ
jgi:hypothetical protein